MRSLDPTYVPVVTRRFRLDFLGRAGSEGIEAESADGEQLWRRYTNTYLATEGHMRPLLWIFMVCHNLDITVGRGEIDAPIAIQLNKRGY